MMIGSIEYVLPHLVRPFHIESGNLVSGIGAFLRCPDLTHAIRATETTITEAYSRATGSLCLLLPAIVRLWDKSESSLEMLPKYRISSSCSTHLGRRQLHRLPLDRTGSGCSGENHYCRG